MSPDHVPEPRLSVPPPAPPNARAAGGAELADVELGARIRTALTIRAGNMTQVAKDLGMSRSTLYEAVERLQIDPRRFRR
jgi:transcriptional regulator of acetoin/glycerol metabolism